MFSIDNDFIFLFMHFVNVPGNAPLSKLGIKLVKNTRKYRCNTKKAVMKFTAGNNVLAVSDVFRDFLRRNIDSSFDFEKQHDHHDHVVL